jgi:hypothetical protein
LRDLRVIERGEFYRIVLDDGGERVVGEAAETGVDVGGGLGGFGLGLGSLDARNKKALSSGQGK